MKFLYALWEFPQIVLGIVIAIILKLQKKIKATITIRYHERNYTLYVMRHIKGRMFTGGSFSSRIFLDEMHRTILIRHEIGHSIQSRMWGWLYLPIIGIRSISVNLKSRRWRRKEGKSTTEILGLYHSEAVERQANKLVGMTHQDIIKEKENLQTLLKNAEKHIML